MEHSVIGSAAENQSAAGGQHWSPVFRRGIFVCPDALPGIHIPRLYFADMIRAGNHRERRRDAHKRLATVVLRVAANQGAAQVFVGRDIHHSRLRIKGSGRPVLAAGKRRAVGDGLAGGGLMRRVNFRFSRLRVKPREHVLRHKRLAFDEMNGAFGAFEEPEVAVARRVNHAFIGLAAAFEIDEDGRRYFVPVPGIIRVVLMVTANRAGRDIEGDHGSSVEIVAGAFVTHPWAAVAGAPVGEIQFGVIVAGDPHGRATSLPLIAFGPGFAARLTGFGNRVGPPLLLAGFGIKGCHKTANAILAA